MSEHFVQINVTGSRARRLTYTSAGNARLESVNLSELEDDQVMVKTRFSGISKGTESLVFHGNVPTSERDRMQCPHMAGEFGFPISYGYSCVGEIISTGSKARNLKIGDLVFVLHPHQDRFIVLEESCNLLPDDIAPKRAVLAANVETAVNAVWDAEISGTPSCAVIGAGVVGLLTAHAARNLYNLDPVIIDIDLAKEKRAADLGLKFINASEKSLDEASEFDLIFHTSASANGLQTAIDIASFEGNIVEMSWYGNREVSLNLGGKFHSQRLSIISSQVGTIAKQKRSELTFSDRMKAALSLLNDNRLETLLVPAIEFEKLPDHLEDIFSPQSNALCQVVKY